MDETIAFFWSLMLQLVSCLISDRPFYGLRHKRPDLDKPLVKRRRLPRPVACYGSIFHIQDCENCLVTTGIAGGHRSLWRWGPCDIAEIAASVTALVQKSVFVFLCGRMIQSKLCMLDYCFYKPEYDVFENNAEIKE